MNLTEEELDQASTLGIDHKALSDFLEDKELCGDPDMHSLEPVEDRRLDAERSGYNPYGSNDGKGCASCQWFISPNMCLVVSEPVSPTGMSNLWLAKMPEKDDDEESAFTEDEEAFLDELYDEEQEWDEVYKTRALIRLQSFSDEAKENPAWQEAYDYAKEPLEFGGPGSGPRKGGGRGAAAGGKSATDGAFHWAKPAAYRPW